jgi:uncharacterized protein YqhQ
MPRGEYLQYGGQAIIEGVMMRSPRYFSVACRAPNGEIVVQTEAIEKTWIGRQNWLKLAFLRGSLALLDAMALGLRAMRFASNVQMAPEYQTAEEREAAEAKGEKPPNQRIQDGAIVATIIVSLVFGLLIFNYLPNLISEYANRALGTENFRVTNLIAELVKIVIFLGYVGLIGQMKDIREVFKYHGAEHKAINTLEHDRPLMMEECKLQSRLHPRCGTSFAMIVLIVGLLIFTFVPRYPVTGMPGTPLIDVTVRFFIELMILPIISGIAYELLRLAGKFRNQSIVNAFFKPGIWSQYLTTREPDEKQIEVALIALQAVIDAEDNHGKTDAEVNVLESGPTILPTGPTVS